MCRLSMTVAGSCNLSLLGGGRDMKYQVCRGISVRGKIMGVVFRAI